MYQKGILLMRFMSGVTLPKTGVRSTVVTSLNIPSVHFVIVGGGLKPEWTDEYRNVSYMSIDSFKDIM